MQLTKGGVTVDVSHPSDIKRYKALGYVEEKSPEQKNAEAIKAVNSSEGTPSAEPGSKKTRGKQEPVQKPDEGGES